MNKRRQLLAGIAGTAALASVGSLLGQPRGNPVRIGATMPAYRTLRESLTNAVRLPFRRSGRTTREETIWALKDVDFEIKAGEVVGIVDLRPLLTVHDSVLFQAPVEHRAWVAEHIPAWFTNPLTVAGTTFIIPFECGVGPSWGELQPLTIPTH